MGRVFSVDDVQKGRVPGLEDFVAVRQKVFAALRDSSAIESALEFGATNRGDHNRRSDLDCAVVYDWEQHVQAFDLMEGLACEASSAHISLTFELCDSSIANTGYHRFGPSFRQHLRRAHNSGGVIKGDVCRHFDRGMKVPVADELKGYLAQKLSKLQNGRVMFFAHGLDSSHQAHYLQKMIEAPMHVARKTLACLGVQGADSKASVVDEYHKGMPQELSAELDYFLKLDADYSRELDQRLSDGDLFEYSECLGRLFGNANRIIGFVRANVILVDRFG